ncbi:hypothetical protein J6590_029785 [Homalodisca vitripennis]|nr:hypothetical protein J6590_029785 [Homalodisca vitripennis]
MGHLDGVITRRGEKEWGQSRAVQTNPEYAADQSRAVPTHSEHAADSYLSSERWQEGPLHPHSFSPRLAITPSRWPMRSSLNVSSIRRVENTNNIGTERSEQHYELRILSCVLLRKRSEPTVLLAHVVDEAINIAAAF